MRPLLAAAISLLLTAATASAATLQVHVTGGGTPIAATVAATGPAGTAVATGDGTGTATLTLPDGSYTVTAQAEGYAVGTSPAPVPVSDTTSTSLALTRSASNFDPLAVFGGETELLRADGTSGVFYVSDFVIPQIFRTTDFGGTWAPVTIGYDDKANGLTAQFAMRHNIGSPQDLATSGSPGEVAAFVNGVVYSTDFGLTWKTVGNSQDTIVQLPQDQGGGAQNPSLYWAHAGSTSVLLARTGNTWFSADMTQASPSFTQMTTGWAGTGEPVAVGEGADQPWIAVYHTDGTATVHPLTAGGAPTAATATVTGLPSAPQAIGLGGQSAAGHPPSGIVAVGSSPKAIALATKDPASDAYTSASANASGGANDCVGNDPGFTGWEMAVAPTTGGTSGLALIGACAVRRTGDTLTLSWDYSALNSFSAYAFDAGYDGAGDQVVLAKEGSRGAIKSAAAGGDGAPSFPVTQDAAPGTAPTSGGFAVNGISTPTVADAVFGGDPNLLATVLDNRAGAASLASADGGVTVKAVVRRGGEAVDWWQGATAKWLVFANGGTFLDQGTQPNLITAVADWTSATPTLDTPNLQGTKGENLGCNGGCLYEPALSALAGAPGADSFFVAQSPGNGFGSQPAPAPQQSSPAHVFRVDITPGQPPSAKVTEIIAGQATGAVGSLAYCPAGAGPSSDVLLVGVGGTRTGGRDPHGELIRVSGALGDTPTGSKVGSLGDLAIDAVTADCPSGTVYAGTGGGVGDQQTPGQLFKSTDGGVTFTEVPLPACTNDCPGGGPGGGGGYADVRAIAINPANANEVLISTGEDGLTLRSTDGGATWATVNDPAAGGRNFTTRGILDIAIPPPATAASRAFGSLRAFSSRSALAATGGGAYVAAIRGKAAKPKAPKVSRLKIKPKRFKVGRKVVISFRASKKGTVRLRFTKGKRSAGSMTKKVRKGANRVTFRGKVGKKKLKPGVYTLHIGAAKANFRVLKR